MQTQITSIGTFVGGLNTEQPQLADQIQYTTDELNCQLLPDGTRARRYGFTREESSVGIATSYIEPSGEEEEEEGFLVEYADETPMTKEVYKTNGQKEYTIVIPETALYTITMVGAGSYEGNDLGYSVQGAAGAGITFSTVLEKGEYTVKVGYCYPFNYKKQDVTFGILRTYTFRNGAATTFSRPGIINVSAGGATGAVVKRRGSSWNTTTHAFSGNLVVSEHPAVYTVVSQTTEHQEEYEDSFITGDTTGFGAINKNGYFKITKGQPTDSTITINNGKTEAYYWANYDKEGKDCIVLQQGSLLRFFKAERPYDSEEITSIDTGAQIKDTDNFSKYSFSSGEGFLLVTSEYAEPFYISLTSSGAILVPINLQIRDLEGLDDGLVVDDYPTTLSDRHKYNLLNQGWDDTKINSYHSSQSKYPSNALIWWYGKDSNGDFNVSTLTKQYFGTTPAPRGHYILDYFNQDRSTASGIAGLEPVVKNKYCVSSEFFAGRFFYLASSTVLFSQIIREDVRGIGRCYQEADPTAQTISDIIATDGGMIRFQDLGYGKRIKKFPLGILVFGSKTVYAVTSSSTSTFNATQYLTQFVTNAGCFSGGSVVEAEDVVYYWSPQGIYQITVDTISGTQAIASSLSASTIQQWYNNLPNFSKENCKGAYDYTNRRIVWMYPTDENDLDNRDGVLVYYVDFKAFLPAKISEGGKAITVFETVLPTFIIPSIGLYAGDQDIVAGTNDVIVKNFGEEYGRNFSVCYVGYIKEYDRLFFCDFSSREFTDWNTHLYNSFAVSYPITFGSTWQKQYTPVLQCYYLRTEEDELTNGTYLAPSSCYLSARWKWGETQESDRWDLVQESYIHIPRFMEFKYVNGKIRVRGSGPAVQYKIESKEDNDFKLSGMNMLIRTVV